MTQRIFRYEIVEERRLRPHHVANRHQWKIESVRLASRRVDFGGSRRSHAAADHVRADDEEAVRVDGLSRPDEDIPPARLSQSGCTLAAN